MEQTGTTEQPDRHWDHKLQSTSQSATSPLSGTNTVNQSTNGSIAETVNSMMISVDLECSDSGTYLGFDLSTQQLKAIVINESCHVLHEQSVHFDSELPEFRTQGGVNRVTRSAQVTVNPIMWIKALELLMDKLKIAGAELGQVRCVGGCAQQHGSVYWRKGSEKVLQQLNSSKFLHSQLQNAFSLRDSPIWMDSSTLAECDWLETEIGGADHLAEITGSRAYARFTGAQIAKLRKQNAAAYDQTERISLVSSFAASLLLGRYAPIDLSDASGMNLLDLRPNRPLDWHMPLIRLCGSDRLAELLGQPVATGHVLGCISSYFVQRHGFSEHCRIISFTGDNPASLVGMCARDGDIAISLGTSDTLFFSTGTARTSRTGHVLVSPLRSDHRFVLVCFKNGSQTRERVSRDCAENNWTLFAELLDSTPRGNFGNLALYLDQVEIRPRVAGDFRFNRFDQPVSRFSKEVEVRACVEGQFVRLRAHAQQMGFAPPTTNQNVTLSSTTSDDIVADQLPRLLATGGASRNRSLLQVLADVFNCPVYVQKQPNSACFGSALLAKNALLSTPNIEQVMRMAECLELVAEPAADSNSIYAEMAARYLAIEAQLERTAK